MSMTETLPSGPVSAETILRRTLLRALGDGITYRRTGRWHCADCADALCPDHDGDDALALDYETARTIIASATTRGDPIMTDEQPLCHAHPDDCPNGPEPHAYHPPELEGLPCCRQPGEPGTPPGELLEELF